MGIVDTAGLDEYSRLSRNASIGVHGYVLVFSITSRQSFDRIKQINESLLSALGDVTDVPRVLVGCMKDLSLDQRKVAIQVCIIFTVFIIAYIKYFKINIHVYIGSSIIST